MESRGLGLENRSKFLRIRSVRTISQNQSIRFPMHERKPIYIYKMIVQMWKIHNYDLDIKIQSKHLEKNDFQ